MKPFTRTCPGHTSSSPTHVDSLYPPPAGNVTAKLSNQATVQPRFRAHECVSMRTLSHSNDSFRWRTRTFCLACSRTATSANHGTKWDLPCTVLLSFFYKNQASFVYLSSLLFTTSFCPGAIGKRGVSEILNRAIHETSLGKATSA